MIADITQTLRDTENALRDFIAYILNKHLGPDWESQSGVTAERLAKWSERRETEVRRQGSGAPDRRLIYYADFYDLKTILKKHWDHFAPALADLKTTEVWLTELEKLRDPDAHRRELLPHQKDLVAGISGELRTKIARYRSTCETSDSYYPRIEFAADNLGNSWKLGEEEFVKTGKALRVGDVVEYVVTATDPLGEDLEYQCTFAAGSPGHTTEWHPQNNFRIKVSDEHVGKLVFGAVSVRSNRKYHAHGFYDDCILFTYEVLPPRGF